MAVPQVKQEKVDAPEEWTAGTTFLTSSTLQPGFPSKVRAVMGILQVPYRWSVNESVVSRDGHWGQGGGCTVGLASVSSRCLLLHRQLILPAGPPSTSDWRSLRSGKGSQAESDLCLRDESPQASPVLTTALPHSPRQ